MNAPGSPTRSSAGSPPGSPPPATAPSATAAMWRGLRRRCPRCGEGRLFEGFYGLRERCPTCSMVLKDDTPDQIAVIYLTTAVQTAAFAFLVLMVHPPNPWLARAALGLVAVGIMVLDLPNRKGLAIALDYLTDRETEDEPAR